MATREAGGEGVRGEVGRPTRSAAGLVGARSMGVRLGERLVELATGVSGLSLIRRT